LTSIFTWSGSSGGSVENHLEVPADFPSSRVRGGSRG
jgi:hypothetical protein